MAFVGPGSPYISPAMLQNSPTGISWKTLAGQGAGADQITAAQMDICLRATHMIDAYCNVPLRATIDTETLFGPGNPRFQTRPNGVSWLLLSRPPVVKVISGQYSPSASFPEQWTAIPANQFKVVQPLMGVYGTSAPGASGEGAQDVLLGPGYVGGTKDSCEVQVTYLNGWPHATLTAASAANASTVQVDDVTGWLNAAGIVYDATEQEAATVTAVTPNTPGALSGPGTLTLSAPLGYAHAAGTVFTTLPGNVIQAAILYAVSQALVRGATAVSPQQRGGGNSGDSGKSSAEYAAEAELLVHRYRRTL